MKLTIYLIHILKVKKIAIDVINGPAVNELNKKGIKVLEAKKNS